MDFWGVEAPITSNDEGNSKYANPKFNEEAAFGHVNLELKMEFTSLEAFKKGVKDHTI